ncbi:MAG: hypothetical protein D6732_16635 [Methanobacteriota archaeon]|nr:MAG: hypothetical protein D6732_16635 [Euryarchaeota archaeon]
MNALAQAKEFVDRGMLNEALTILEEGRFDEDEEIEAWILKTKIKMIKGEFQEALAAAEKSVELSEARRDYIINLKDRILQLGDLWKQGKFKECYEIMMLTKEKIREGVDFDVTQEAVAKSYETLGILNYNQGLFDEAIANLTKSLETVKRYGLKVDTCNILFYLSLSYVEQENSAKVEETKKILAENLNSHNCENASSINLKLIEAMEARRKPTWKEKAKAEERFEEIIAEKSLPFDLHVFTLTHYCDLLLEQLQSVDNEEIFDKAKKITKEIYELAEAKESYNLLVNVLILKAKFAILDLDLETAYSLLDQADEIAKEKRMAYHKLQIENLRSIITSELEEVEKKIRQNLTLKERLDLLTYHDFFDLAINTRKKEEN